MWFEKLTGFKEESPEQVRANLEISGSKLRSRVNGKSYHFGKLEVLSLVELGGLAPSLENFGAEIRASEAIANVQDLHCDPQNAGALFQAASQFNLLEMASPGVTPERGVGIYQYDHTQGPACAIACGAGTIYRNYFAEVNGQIGQSSNNQIDCLRDLGREFGNEEMLLWNMQNGYAFANKEGLKNISQQIKSKSKEEYQALKGMLQLGIQWDSEVSLSENKHRVTQAYCSALPVAYSQINSSHWEDFARLILEATYEATFYAALINLSKTSCNKVFLTRVGGGVFGNHPDWINDAIRQAIYKFKNTSLDVRIVSYGSSNASTRELLAYLR